MLSGDMPFESRNKYGGEVDWDGGADEFVGALDGDPNVSGRPGGAAVAPQPTDDSVDESVFREAGNQSKYLGRD